MVTLFTQQTTPVCFWEFGAGRTVFVEFGSLWCYTTAEIVGLRENKAISVNAGSCKQGVWTSVIKEQHFLSIMSLCGRASAFEVQSQ